jgi:hypothetical protein
MGDQTRPTSQTRRFKSDHLMPHRVLLTNRLLSTGASQTGFRLLLHAKTRDLLPTVDYPVPHKRSRNNADHPNHLPHEHNVASLANVRSVDKK